MKKWLILTALTLPISSFACDQHEEKEHHDTHHHTKSSKSNGKLTKADQKIIEDFNNYKATLSAELLKELDSFYKEKIARRNQDKESYKKLSEAAKDVIKKTGEFREKVHSYQSKKQIILTEKS